jgi:hypothetical protein
VSDGTRTVDRVDLPRWTLRKRLGFRWFGIKWKARSRWLKIVAPHRLHPETLYGYDGEPPYFVRADLAGTRLEAAEYLARDSGIPLVDFGSGMKPIDMMKRVWMREHVHVECPNPDDCEDDDCPGHEEEGMYDPVDPGTRGAIAYWRWDW